VTVTATVEEAVKLSSLWDDEFPLSESGYDWWWHRPLLGGSSGPSLGVLPLVFCHLRLVSILRLNVLRPTADTGQLQAPGQPRA